MLCYYTCNSAPPSCYKISEYVNCMGEENSEENFSEYGGNYKLSYITVVDGGFI